MYKGKKVTVCIPVLNNYAGLREMINSIEEGIIKPDQYYVFDNGLRFDLSVYGSVKDIIQVYRPEEQVALSAAWNFFLDHTEEYRLILNDDLIFYKETLRDFLAGISDDTITVTTGASELNAFSFFAIPDSVVSKVGKFDESFYPAYYEDNDYNYRCQLQGISFSYSDCNLIHTGSQTFKNFSRIEQDLHHLTFRRNTEHYISKWGGLPTKETFTTPYGQ